MPLEPLPAPWLWGLFSPPLSFPTFHPEPCTLDLGVGSALTARLGAGGGASGRRSA